VASYNVKYFKHVNKQLCTQHSGNKNLYGARTKEYFLRGQWERESSRDSLSLILCLDSWWQTSDFQKPENHLCLRVRLPGPALSLLELNLRKFQKSSSNRVQSPLPRQALLGLQVVLVCYPSVPSLALQSKRKQVKSTETTSFTHNSNLL
jgi:hypothetical protein